MRELSTEPSERTAGGPNTAPEELPDFAARHFPVDSSVLGVLARRYAPASALIDSRCRVCHLHGAVGDYLQLVSGPPTYDLLAMARPGLQVPLRVAVSAVLAAGREVSCEAQVHRNGGWHPVRLVVTPLDGDLPDLLLVGFLDDRVAGDGASRPALDEDAIVTRSAARKRFGLIVDSLAALNEELNLSNDALRLINEDLRAGSIELESANNDLAAANEEIKAINRRLEARLTELEVRTDDLNNLLNSSDVATLFLDRQLCIRWFTPALKALFDLVPADVGRPISHFAQRFRGGNLREDAVRVLSDLSPIDAEVVSDQGRWYIRRMVPYRASDDRILGVVVTFTDISERKRSEEALFFEKERAQVTLHSIADAVIATTFAGTVHYLNPVAEALTGWPLQEAFGQPIETVFQIRDEHSGTPGENPVRRCLEEGRTVAAGSHAVLVDRSRRQCAVQESAAPIRDREGTVIGAVLVFRDVTEARRLALEATRQADHDPLTGLLNRRAFERRLEHAYVSATTRGARHVLCFIDLDCFKLVNDTAGHAAGDELLKQVASLLTRHCRSRDVLARIGGDEFCLLMEHCEAEQATTVCASIIAAIRSRPFVFDNKGFSIGASVGLATIDSESAVSRKPLVDADLACYAAKENGGNRIKVAESNDTDQRTPRIPLIQIGHLHQAIAESRLRLFCQPIRAVRQTGSSTGMYEILVRLVNQEGLLVPPTAFVPMAERYGLMPAIDRWVIREGFRQSRHLLERDAARIVTINLSGQTINDETILDFIVANLDEAGFPADRLCLEITETAAIHSFSQAAEFIEALQRRGCRFALDDFGKGVSSLTYLRHLRVDYLKIDGNLVLDMAENGGESAMVSAVNELAHALGLETIAEWVETDEMVDVLTTIGVDYVQGYATGGPRPVRMRSPLVPPGSR